MLLDDEYIRPVLTYEEQIASTDSFLFISLKKASPILSIPYNYNNLHPIALILSTNESEMHYGLRLYLHSDIKKVYL